MVIVKIIRKIEYDTRGVSVVRDTVGPIIEGLSSVKVYEGTSSFSPKLNSFIKSEDKAVQDKIKKVLNAIFLWTKKKYDGYVEGQVSQSNLGSCKTLTMEIKTNKLARMNALDLMIILRSLKSLNFEVGTFIPYSGYGHVYNACLIDGDGKKIEMDEYSPSSNTLVGVACSYDYDTDSEGYKKVSTIIVIVSIPTTKV